MDKANGQPLQTFKGHLNKDYRIRSTLAFADSTMISGSEDGRIYAWDLLSGDVLEKLDGHGGKVASDVACNAARKEWATGGIDGECCQFPFALHVLGVFKYFLLADFIMPFGFNRNSNGMGITNTMILLFSGQSRKYTIKKHLVQYSSLSILSLSYFLSLPSSLSNKPPLRADER